LVTCSAGETQTLIKFKGSLSNATALRDWDGSSISPCGWTGVWCLNGRVWQLKLDWMGLGGLLDMDSLAELPLLRILSIRGNGFEGSMPEVKKLAALKAVSMSSNRFTGEIPDDGFDGMKALKMVYLDRNGFTGLMPKSLANLPRLVSLSLEGNQMGGKIPDFRQTELQMVDLANNQFEGKIPPGLRNMNSSYFQANRRPGQPGLDWPTRLKIIKGVAKGLEYLYKELPGLSLPHGHLKSSNVLLDRDFTPLLTDYGLVPLINKDHAQQFMVAFKSPEFIHSDRTTKKTEVWSLGILILEIITGKFPANYLKQGKGANADLATWVNSVVREEWTGEVFDKDMRGTKKGEGEMLKLLKIGMCCCEWNVERRWSLREAVDRIEELRERDSDEEYSSYASEGEFYSSR
ncbi:Protein kinase domain-containing protein, partial [Psidium guajava]